MSASTKKTHYHKDFVVVTDKDHSVPPLTCPVCNFFMKTDLDVFYWNIYECCHECGVTWAEGPNKEKWIKGWRPSEEIVNSDIERRSKIVPRLKL